MARFAPVMMLLANSEAANLEIEWAREEPIDRMG